MARLVIATALNVMFCWYTACISILFLCIFVLVEFVDYVAEQGFNWKLMLDRALRFAGAIVLGLLLSTWTFLPTILAMSKGGPVLALGPLLKTGLKSLIRGFLPGMWMNNDSTPQFYCGIIMMLLAVSLLFNRKVSIKTRIATLVVTILPVASSVLSPLEYIWCGMRVPNGFYTRTAFLLSFFALWAAGYALQAQAIAPLSSLECSSVGEFSTRYAKRILAVDALLGVKYAIVEQAPAGYVTMSKLSGTTSAVHENLYALSLGIAASKDIQNCTLKGENPFEKQDNLNSKIVGHKVELYTKIEATNTENSDPFAPLHVKSNHG